MKTLQLGLGWFPEYPSGLDRFYYDCAHYLPKAGIEFKGLVAGSANVARDSHDQVRAFAPHESSLLHRWQSARKMVSQELSTADYDLVASHFSLYALPTLGLMRDVPLVTHFQGPWALESAVEGQQGLGIRVKKYLESLSYKQANHFIVLSEAFRQLLHREYQIPLEMISVVPGGVATARFDLEMSPQQARRKLDWPGDDRKILFTVRRLANRMGLENLIYAISIVRQTYPEVLLLIAGKGALSETLQAQIESLDLTDHVKLLGFVPDDELPVHYRAANLSVVPTTDLEGFGLVVVESLAAGTPVLGTPVSAIPEILTPLSQDLLFEGTTAGNLAQGIQEALTDVRQLPDSDACKQYAQQRYDWRVIAQQIKQVYELAVRA